MINRLAIGEKRTFRHKVTGNDLASFDSGMVHEVCATFVLAKHIEWVSRLFIIDIKEEEEEGIGTKIIIDHIAPAFQNQELLLEAVVKSIYKNELVCEVNVMVENRIIAKAETGQKLLKKSKIKEIFSSLADSK